MDLRLEMRQEADWAVDSASTTGYEGTSELDNAFKTGDEADWAVYGASTTGYEGT